MSAPARTNMATVGLQLRGVSGELADGPQPFPTVQVMVGEPPAPPSLLVDRLLLDVDINLWAAHGGSAKSTLLLHTAVCIALGRRVFGTLAVHRPGPVLLVLPEDGQAVARMMLDAIAAGLALEEEERALLAERLVMVSDEVLVNITRDARRLADTALQHGAVLVVLDPLRNVLGDAEENDNDTAGSCLALLRHEVCRRAGAGLLITHHNRKPGKDGAADSGPSVHDTRGGGGWSNGSRLVFGLTKRDSRVTLKSVKSNRVRSDLQHDVALAITADPKNEAHWLSCSITDANAGAASAALTPGVGRAINENERKALAAIDDRHEPGARFSWSRWHEGSGIKSGDTFRSVRDRLLDAGLARAEPTGRMNRNGKSPEYQYGITERGRTALHTGWTTTEGVKL